MTSIIPLRSDRYSTKILAISTTTYHSYQKDGIAKDHDLRLVHTTNHIISLVFLSCNRYPQMGSRRNTHTFRWHRTSDRAYTTCANANRNWLTSTAGSIQVDDAPTRAEFVARLQPGGPYEGTVGIYRRDSCAPRIGVFDRELVGGLPPSVKWIAHNGAGYNQIDVRACQEKGEFP